MSIKKRDIEYAESLDLETRAEIIYRHLVLSESTRKIEREVLGIAGDGWESWKVLKVYGYSGSTKGLGSSERNNPLVKKEVLESIRGIDISNLDREVGIVDVESIDNIDIFLENDGKNVLRIGTVRVGQAKWRNKILQIHNNKCAMCDVSHPSLLVASHIKSWKKCTQYERIDLTNGIALCGIHDKLFDKGFISLSSSFEVLYSDKYDFDDIGIDKDIKFSHTYLEPQEREKYLSWHRKYFKFEK